MTLFDASHPREKPCGGGVTGKALALLPPASAGDPLPARWVRACRFESGRGEELTLRLERPVAIAARRDLDAWLLRRACASGARHVTERVVWARDSEAPALGTADGAEHAFDVVVGADGAGSLLRRTFLGPTPTARLTMAAGWFASGEAPMTVRFMPGLAGYLWLFPRLDHVGVGVCAPLRSAPTRVLLERLEREVTAAWPELARAGRPRYAHTIPSPSSDPGSILEIADRRWALVGDAAALADPITGEGIFYALRSAQLLAETLLQDGNAARYPARALEDFGRDLLKAAALHRCFYADGFTPRMLRFASRSAAIRRVLGDLVLGEQGYLGLKRRLLRTLPAFLWQAATEPKASA